MLTGKLLSLFAQHTYPILFLWVFGEQVGCPLPSAPLLIATGALCTVSNGSWVYAFATVLVACLLADYLWYQLGRSYGRSLLTLLMKITLVSPASLIKAGDKLDRYNGVALLFAKFIPGVSTLAPPLSGHSGMSRARFLFWDLLGSLLWAAVWLLGGQLLLRVVEASGRFLRMESTTALEVAAYLLVAFVLWRVIAFVRLAIILHRTRLSPAALQAMIAGAEGRGELPPYVVDLRIPRDFAIEPRHIPNAIRVEPHSLKKSHQVIPRDREVVLYCSCPSEATSTFWALRLRRYGIKRVRLLRGGMEGWREAGYGLQTPPRDATPAEAGTA